MTFFECTQRHTGLSEGASEGTLFEAKKVSAGKAVFHENKNREPTAVVVPDDPSAAKSLLVPGYFVAALGEKPRWARIVRIEQTDGKVWELILDQSLQSFTREGLVHLGAVPMYFGNAIAETAFLRCQFLDGKSGIWFWGMSLGNAVVGCEFRDLESAIEILDRQRGPTDTAFTINLLQRHNRYRDVTNNLKILK